MYWPARSLATFIREQADWRRSLARKFPNDRRNAPAIDALEKLAVYVEQLDASDAEVKRIVVLAPFADDQTFHAGPNALKLVSRHGYLEPVPAPRALLQDLVLAIAEDRKREQATWRPGAGSLRFDYPSRYTATYKGELVDVLSLIAVPYGTPNVLRCPDGAIDLSIPTAFHQDTVRFLVRGIPPLGSVRGERWVHLDELTDGPHPAGPEPEWQDPGETWPRSELDGSDTFLWSRAPLEVGIVSKFELSAQDVYKKRIVGDWFEVSGRSDLHDVVVAVDEHFVPTMRFVRVVRCATPIPDEPRAARGHAVHLYLDRCGREGRTPSGWVNRVEPNWWGGMPFDELTRIADAGGPLWRAASDELWRRGYFKVGDRWVEQFDSPRGPGYAVGRGTIVRTRQPRR